jgi:dTDP-glucose pyrophosphorylase
MHYKVCILAAGNSTRTKKAYNLHKALLPINNKPIISLIIEQFPKNIEILITLGYQGEKIKFLVQNSYPDRKIKFLNIKNYNKQKTGPGLTLLECKKFLNCPFIFTSVDTIIREKITVPNQNWIMTGKVLDSANYLTLQKVNGNLSFFNKKICNVKNKYFNAFSGIAGIYDYKNFFKGLEKKSKENPLEVFEGLKNIKNLKIINTQWLDTGTVEKYNETKEILEKKRGDLQKQDEQIYFINKFVIKFFSKKKKINNLIKKHIKFKKISPKIIKHNKNFIIYKYINGEKLSDVSNPNLFKKFLFFMKKNFWYKKAKNNYSEINSFYKNKTLNRLKILFKNSDVLIEKFKINNVIINNVKNLILRINWKTLIKESKTTYCHGDPQPENIIVNKNNIKVIDFRDSFGKNIFYFDIYYDLAKIHHALMITNKMVRQNKFYVKENKNNVFINFKKYRNLTNNINILRLFCKKNNLNFQKVELLSSLIYLNISPLYKTNYSKLLYYYGVLKLNNFLRNKKNEKYNSKIL